VRKKFIPHSTRKRIDKLTYAGRTEVNPDTGYSPSELDGYDSLFDMIALRTGEVPGLTAEERKTPGNSRGISRRDSLAWKP
jgi:hypothetical protein